MTIEHEQEKYHITFGSHKPVMVLRPGQSVSVTVPDCDGLGPDRKKLPDERFMTDPNSPALIGNPVAGPYYIEDTEPGDSITVHLEKIDIDRDFGRTGISAKQIQIPPKLMLTDKDHELNVQVPQKISLWKINHDTKTARLKLENSSKKYIEVPINPFLGCLAVAPDNNQFIHTLYSGKFGGNIDISGLGVGSAISLPVFTKGALLFMGDIHAAQGDGEVIGGGIEVGGNITFSVELQKGKRIDWPRLETEEIIGAIGIAENLQNAFEISYAQLTLWLMNDYGYDRWEALHLISQAVQARPGNFNSAICTINKSLL